MESRIKKNVSIELNEAEALDLRSILFNYVEEYELNTQQSNLVCELKEILNEI